MNAVKDELFQWACEKHATHGCLNKNKLREKALDLSRSRGFTGFKCSEKWLTQFLKDYGFSLNSRDHRGPIFENYNDWIDVMRSIISRYKHKDLFHADELTMFTETQPSCVSSSNNDRVNPKKPVTHNRVTILISCNSSGTVKLPLLICGPYPSKITAKEHVYCHTDDSGIGDDLFRNWLVQVNGRMMRSGRKIALFLNRSRAHALKEFFPSNVKLVYLPDEFPSHLKPLRRDIFHYIKMVFRRRYTERLCQQPLEWGLRDVLSSLIEAWETIPRELIIFSFQRTRFRTDDCFLQFDCDSWDKLKPGISFKTFVTFDDNLSEQRPRHRTNAPYDFRDLGTNRKGVIQIDEDSVESVAASPPKFTPVTSSNEFAHFTKTPEKVLDERNERSNRKITSHAGTNDGPRRRDDLHHMTKRYWLNMSSIPKYRPSKKSRTELGIVDEIELPVKRKRGYRRSSREKIENDSSVSRSRSVGKRGHERRQFEKRRTEADDDDTLLHTMIQDALSLSLPDQIDYVEKLNDILHTLEQSQMEDNDDQFGAQERVNVRDNFEDFYITDCGNPEQKYLNKSNKKTRNNGENKSLKTFEQPSTSTDIPHPFPENINEATVGGNCQINDAPSIVSPANQQKTSSSGNSVLIPNFDNDCTLSSLQEEALTSSSKKRRKSSETSTKLEDECNEDEPRTKEPKMDHDWSKEFENTFVFGSQNENCSLLRQQEKNNLESCVLNSKMSSPSRETDF